MKPYFQNMSSGVTLMNSFLVAVTYLTVLDQASAATCPTQTALKCQATDYTLATCNNSTLVCDCKPGYLPIPTGCAAMLKKPTVTLDPGRTAQFVPGAAVRLTCATIDTGSLVFEWIKDGVTVANQNTSVYTITGTDQSKNGNFSCIVRDNSVNFTSEASDKKEILILTSQLAAVVVQAVTVPTKTAATGVKLDVQCINIPYGATFTFKLGPGDTTVDTVTQNTTNKNVKCVLDAVTNIPWGKPESDPVDLPTEETDITTAAIDPSTFLTFKTGSTVNLTCVTDLAAKFLENGTNTIAYTFKDSADASPVLAGNIYTIKSVAGNVTTRSLTCAASYAKKAEKTSIQVNVSFSDTYIKPPPTVNASSTEVQTGAPLVLTCVTEDNLKYTWLKDGNIIARQSDRIIQVGSFRPADAGKYACQVTKDSYIASSAEVVITSNAQELRVLSSTVTVLIASISWVLL